MRPRGAAGPCRDAHGRFGKGSTCEWVMEKRRDGFQVVTSVPKKAGQLCLPDLLRPLSDSPELSTQMPLKHGLGPGRRGGLARQLEDGQVRTGEVSQHRSRPERVRSRVAERLGRAQLGGLSAQPRSCPKSLNRRPGSVGVGSETRWGLSPGGVQTHHSSAWLPSSKTIAFSSSSLFSKLVVLGKDEQGQIPHRQQVASRAGLSYGWDPGGTWGLGWGGGKVMLPAASRRQIGSHQARD